MGDLTEGAVNYWVRRASVADLRAERKAEIAKGLGTIWFLVLAIDRELHRRSNQQ